MKKFINNLKRILSFLERKRYLAVLFILMIFRMVFVIGIPIFSSKKVVYITNNMLYQLVILMLFLTVAGILECIVNLINNFFLEKISTEVSSSLQKSLSKEIIKLDDETINRVSSGEIIQRINNDVPTLNNSVVSFYKDFYRLLVFIGYFIGTTIISIHIALFFAVFIIILIFLRKWNMNLLIKDKKVKLHFGEILTGKFNEMCRGVEDLKILNSEKSYLNNVSSNINDYNNFTYKMNMSSYERDNFIAFFRSSNLFLFYCLIIYLITIDNINITNALVAVYFFSRITNFSSSLTNLFKDITDVNLYSERIFNIFDGIGYTKETFGNKHLDKVVGDFEFKHVNFSYVDGKPILKDMSFKIKHDTTVGFVGKSGIGKTTVFNLLCKLYTPSSGNIYIDNVDINDLDRESIRGNITVISQNPYIFNETIRNNFKLIKNDVTDEEIREACKLACLDDFIESLPDKYDTVVGEGGVTLSGGERQRLAIARAFIQKTEIILFDEATSALDNETQESIQEAIDNLQSSYTILIIAHRLSTIKNCDKIYYLEDGHISASGTHKELLKNSSGYRKLYNSEIVKK